MTQTSLSEFNSDRARCDYIIECSDEDFSTIFLPLEESENYISASFANELSFYMGKMTMSHYFNNEHRPRFFQILALMDKARDLGIYFSNLFLIQVLTETMCKPENCNNKPLLLKIYESALKHLPAKCFLLHAKDINKNKNIDSASQNELLGHLKSFILEKVRPEVMNQNDLQHVEQILSKHRGIWLSSMFSTSSLISWNERKKTDEYLSAPERPSIYIMQVEKVADKLNIMTYKSITGNTYYQIECSCNSGQESASLLDYKSFEPELCCGTGAWIVEDKGVAKALFLKLCSVFSIDPVSTLFSDNVASEVGFSPQKCI